MSLNWQGVSKGGIEFTACLFVSFAFLFNYVFLFEPFHCLILPINLTKNGLSQENVSFGTVLYLAGKTHDKLIGINFP